MSVRFFLPKIRNGPPESKLSQWNSNNAEFQQTLTLRSTQIPDARLKIRSSRLFRHTTISKLSFVFKKVQSQHAKFCVYVYIILPILKFRYIYEMWQ